MNSQTQYLKQQNQRLQQQVHFLLDVVDRMAADHEFLGSIACGFAWDLSAACIQWKYVHTDRALEFGLRHYDVDMDTVERMWDHNAKRAEEVL